MIIETIDGEKYEVERTYVNLDAPLIRFKVVNGGYIFLNPSYIKKIVVLEEIQEEKENII